MLSPLSGRADRGYPPLSLLAFRLALLHKRQLESFTAYHKGNLSFLVRDGKVRNIKVTVVFHELRKLRNNAPLSCVRLAFSLGELVRRGCFPRSCMGILLCGFQLIRRQVIFRFFACFYCLIIGENILRFFLVWKHSLDTLKAFSVCYSLGDNNHFLSFGGERVLSLSPMGLGQTEQSLALDLGLNDLISRHELTHQRGNLLSAEALELRHALDNLGAGHTGLIVGQSGEELQNERLIALVLLLGLGLLLVLTAILLGEQSHLMLNEVHGVLGGRAVGHGLTVQHSLNVLETHSLGDTSFVGLFHVQILSGF